MSSAVTTTTWLQSKVGSSVIDRIRPLGTVDRIVFPYQAPGTTRSSVYRAAPVTLAAPSRRGTDRPMVEVVTMMGNKNARGSEAQHLPNRPDRKMPNLATDTPSPVPAIQVGTGSSPGVEPYSQILTAPALDFVAALARQFETRRRTLLAHRADRQRDFDAGAFPTFLASTADVREGDWRVAAIPRDLLDRRVEITGPVDRKMVINALNSGAQVYMADLEDSNAPTWANNLQGQYNLRDAVRRTIDYTGPDGRAYSLADRTATLLVRPRGWHLPEKHLHVNGAPISG